LSGFDPFVFPGLTAESVEGVEEAGEEDDDEDDDDDDEDDDP
jgi:hypothetical protein